MGMTLSEAAEHTGKSKSVLSRAIKTGKLSADKREDESYDIDPVELDRWVKRVAKERRKNGEKRTDRNQDKTLENSVLQAQLNAVNEQKDFWKQRYEELKEDRDDWKDQAKRLLLTQGNEVQPESQSQEVIALPPPQRALPAPDQTEAAKKKWRSWLRTCPLWSRKQQQGASG